MKSIIFLVVFSSLVWFDRADEADFIHATSSGAKVKVDFHVVDQNGQAIPRVKIHVWVEQEYNPKGGVSCDGETDSSGSFLLESKTTGRLRCDFSKEGYYATCVIHDLYDTDEDFSVVENGKWKPYGQKKTIVLKRKIRQMQGVGMNSPIGLKIPVYGKWIGFDFMIHDWLPPYGSGRYDDVLLLFRCVTTDMRYYASMDVSFTNHVCNGAYKMKKDSFSGFTSVYNADAQGQYSSMFRLEFVREKGSPFRESGLFNSEYLVFRTRSVVDKDGKLVAAHYGRIDSPWEFVGPGGMKLRLLLNPIVNDTNLELFLRE